MRILQIVDNLEPYHTGGGYYQPIKQAEFLARDGHEVRVAAVNDLGWGAPLPTIRYVYRPHVFRRTVIHRKIDRVLEEFSDRVLLRRMVRRFRPDWVGGVLTRSAVKAHRLSRRFGVRLFNYVFETPPMVRESVGEEEFQRLMTPDFARLWDRTREAYLASHALFPVSQFTGRYCREWLGGGNVLEPMYPGLDLRTAPRRAAGRMAGQSPMILYVGRLSQGKRLDVLIQAFMRMRLPAELHIAGSGEERGTLEKLAGDRTDIRFHGFVDDDRMWSLYEACDVVAYPTAFEGFGMPPMHALYFRKPCVASDLPVLREVFGDCLEYVSLDDIDGFARTLERVLSDPDYRRRRGDEGHAYVVARFDWEKSARQMVAALEDSCRASSSVGRAVGLEKSDL